MRFQTRLFLLKFAWEGVHDCILTELCPHEVYFFDLFFIMKKPPEPSFEKCSNKNRVISLSNITLILMNRLIQRNDSFLKKRVIWHVLRGILIIDYFAQVSNQFFLEHVCNFSAFEEAIVKHGLGDRYSNLSTELHNLININLSLIFEAQSYEVVIIVQHYIYPMRFMVSVVEWRKDFYLCWRVFLCVWVL